MKVEGEMLEVKFEIRIYSWSYIFYSIIPYSIRLISLYYKVFKVYFDVSAMWRLMMARRSEPKSSRGMMLHALLMLRFK